jgi:hypothetical protein
MPWHVTTQSCHFTVLEHTFCVLWKLFRMHILWTVRSCICTKLVTMLINLIYILDCLLTYVEQIKYLKTYVSSLTCKKYNVTPIFILLLYYKSFTSYSERQTDMTL